jgi:hypothetical protein
LISASRDRIIGHDRADWPTQRDGGRSMETLIGIALIIIATLEIVWIIRTVSKNTPYQA